MSGKKKNQDPEETLDEVRDDEEAEKEDKRKKKHEEIIIFSSLAEIGELINFVEDPTVLEFARAVLDPSENVLVQKNTSLRVSIFKNLKMRKPGELPPSFVFKYSTPLKNKFKELVRNMLFVCLKPNRFHIAQQLMKLATLKYIALVNAILDNRALLEKLVEMSKANDPLISHMGETAILSAAIADHLCVQMKVETKDHYTLTKQAITAGLLHDISLADDAEFLLNDLEAAKDSKHEGKSAAFIKENFPGLNPRIVQSIANHHRLEPIYEGNKEIPLSHDLIVSESICFAEFFFVQLRSLYQFRAQKGENVMDKAFFQMGQAIASGFFHPKVFHIISSLQDKFRAILKYGHEIGLLEKKCLHGGYAIAYPTPRCAQILCSERKYDCEYIKSEYPIQVVQPMESFGRAWKSLQVGEYPKCKLTEELPAPPEEIISMS